MNSRHILAAALVGATLAACGGGGDDSIAPTSSTQPTTPTATPPAAQSVTGTKDVAIQFVAVAGAGNTAVTCGSLLAGLGSVPTNATLTDLRVYLTDVRLVTAQGAEVPVALTANAWQHTSGTDGVVLIDLENGQGSCAAEGTSETNGLIRGTVPEGTYVGFKATVGVPQRLNHSDVMSAAAPLDIMAMGWSWQAGRKFVKIEVDPAGGVTTPSGAAPSTVATYTLHLASTDCTGPNDGSATCARRNLAQVSLPLDPSTQQIAIDVAEVFRATDVRINRNDAVGCMSATTDLDCPSLFASFGLDLATSAQASVPQSVFRTIPK
jgi:uncharacterized repeat protein (TIGR04052 family)